ncbi:hypothetical protein BDV93DRAFT_508432 [Ceratobasidium sp. AG-I]|nr:hypothetical protein BDV93DRAFT_508432 [Ceratobasidium sp. AG-I]
MSSRKKHPPLSTRKQPLIESYFSSKPRPNAVTTSKRLVQTSLRARPIRASKSPAKEEILDLTRSTSPMDESESPPSTKKRKLEPGPSNSSPGSSARHDLFGSILSPMSEAPSPASDRHQTPRQTPPRLEERVKSMLISPSPSHIRRLDSMIVDDPNDIVESSQTQYLHLIFTPPSRRICNVDVQRPQAHATTPTPTSQRAQFRAGDGSSTLRATRSPSVASSHGQADWHVPSSQGEVSEPRTPRKRRRDLMDQPGTPSRAFWSPRASGVSGAAGANVVRSSVTPSSQGGSQRMPPPLLPASVMRNPPSREQGAGKEAGLSGGPMLLNTPKTDFRGRLIAGRSSPSSHFPSSRPPRTQVYREDHVPSSQGESSLAPTELGTVESPRKLIKYPTVDTDLLPFVPSSAPGSQEARAHTPRPNSPTVPAVPAPDFNHLPNPRTPARTIHRDLVSSPTSLPSPRAIFSSLGVNISMNRSTQGTVAPPKLSEAKLSSPTTVKIRPLDTSFLGSPNQGRTMTSPDKGSSPSRARQAEYSPERDQSPSQMVIPSSQPIHDSSQPLEYDIDPEVHAQTQTQLQLKSQPGPFESRGASGLKSSALVEALLPPITVQRSPRLNSSQEDSSQPLPPSQTPIQGSRMDPDRSAAGMDGVFGMLGFGSEADTNGDSLREVDRNILVQSGRETRPHTPPKFDLPPSSPPPETPAHHEGKATNHESQLETPSRTAMKKAPAKATPAKDSPLVRAFELARTRSKAESGSSASRALSSPIAAPRLGGESQLEVENYQGEKHVRGAMGKAHTRSQSVAGRAGSASGPVRPRRVTRSFKSPTSRPGRAYSSPRRSKDAESDFVGSSDVEEQEMEMETRRARLRASPVRSVKGKEPAVLDTPQRKRGYIQIYGTNDFPMNGKSPTTPSREEHLPSSVSPSPIRLHARSPSPLVEDTQTQEESETPWETLRPSQSVSQVLERRVIEEALAEAERGRLLRQEQESERQRAKERAEEEVRAKEAEAREAERRKEQAKVAVKGPNQEPQAVRAPVLEGLPVRQVAVPPNVSTPKSRRIADKEIYIVTPTKVVKRTPVKLHRDRVISMTPSSPLLEGEEGDDEEYTLKRCMWAQAELEMWLVNHNTRQGSGNRRGNNNNASNNNGTNQEDRFANGPNPSSRPVVRAPRPQGPNSVNTIQPPLVPLPSLPESALARVNGGQGNRTGALPRQNGRASASQAPTTGAPPSRRPATNNNNNNQQPRPPPNPRRNQRPPSANTAPQTARNNQNNQDGRNNPNAGRLNQPGPQNSNAPSTSNNQNGQPISKRAAKRRRANERKAAQQAEEQAAQNGGVPSQNGGGPSQQAGGRRPGQGPRQASVNPPASTLATRASASIPPVATSTIGRGLNQTGPTLNVSDIPARSVAQSRSLPGPAAPVSPREELSQRPVRAPAQRPQGRTNTAVPYVPYDPTSWEADSSSDDDSAYGHPNESALDWLLRPCLPLDYPPLLCLFAPSLLPSRLFLLGLLLCLLLSGQFLPGPPPPVLFPPGLFPPVLFSPSLWHRLQVTHYGRPTLLALFALTHQTRFLRYVRQLAVDIDQRSVPHASRSISLMPSSRVGCGQTLEYRDVIRAAKNNKACLARYETLLLRRTLQAEPNFVWCKSTACQQGQLHESGARAPIVICQACRARSCFTHQVPWHTGQTCAQYDAQRASRARETQDNLASEAYIRQHAKACPNAACGRNIEKNDGCDHMTCRRPAGCGHELPILNHGNHHHNPSCQHYAAIDRRTTWGYTPPAPPNAQVPRVAPRAFYAPPTPTAYPTPLHRAPTPPAPFPMFRPRPALTARPVVPAPTPTPVSWWDWFLGRTTATAA